MFSVALSELKERSRQRSDMVNSNFIEDSELTSFINESYSDLYDDMVAANEDYFISEYSFTLSTGEYQEPVPNDFYKLRGVDRQIGGDYLPLRRSTWNQRGSNQYYSGLYNRFGEHKYQLRGSNVVITPNNSAAGNYKLWYIPTYTKLVDDADTIDAVNGWEKLIILDTAIKMLLKEESDTSGLERERSLLYAKMMAVINERDISQPKKIQRVQDLDEWDFFGSRF